METRSQAPAPSWRDPWAIGAVLVGALVRLQGASPSLYSQEAMQAFRLGEPGGFDRFFRMPASIRPFGFSVVADTLAELNRTELPLRALALVPALLALPLAWWLLRSLRLDASTQRLGLWFFAVSPTLISHAQEFKPYSLDVLVVVILTGLVARLHRVHHPATWGALLLCLPVFSWLSHATAFVGPIAVLVVVARQWRAKRPVRALITWMSGTTAGTSLAWQYFVQARDLRREEFHGWQDRFTLTDPLAAVSHGWEIVSDLPAGAAMWLPELGQAALGVAHAGLVGLGVVGLFRSRRWWALALTLGVLGAVFGASVLGVWPWGAVRVNTFLVVPVWLLLVCGVAALPRARVWMAAAVAVAVIELPLPLAAYPSTWQRMDVREAIAEHAPRLRADPDGGSLWIAHNAQWIARYYIQQHKRTRHELGADVDALEAEGRVRWVPFQGQRLARWMNLAVKQDQRATAVFTKWDDDAREAVAAQAELGVRVRIEEIPGGFVAHMSTGVPVGDR